MFKSVTVFGGVTIDRIAASSDPPVMGASNPGKARSVPGGVGLNVAMVLARLGIAVRLVARVGDDADGSMALATAERAGIDASGVGVSEAAPTASYHATFDERGGLIIGIADMSINDELAPATVARMALAAGKRELWVIDANLPADTIAFLVDQARADERPVAAIAVSPAKARRLVPLLDHLTYLFANCREAAAMIDRQPDEHSLSASSLAAELARAGVAHVVVTNSDEPLAAASRGELRALAPLRAAVKSVNGAGDALAAGTIHGLAGGHDLFEAVLSGLAAAAITMESGSVAAATFSPAILARRIAGGQRAQR